MPPVSSLVFVVILAVWAVYLVQHWVRRRDHLATARSVDRFSEAMRVLERRRSLLLPEDGAHPRSYATSPLRPARPGRPEVVVKRAVPRPHGATAVAPSRDHRRSLRVARLRGGGLLAGSLTMVVVVGLAVPGVLPRWSALVGVGVCAAAFALVRWSVAQERASWRRTRTPAAGRDPAATAGRGPAATVGRGPAAAGRGRAPARRAPAARVSATGRTAPVGHRSSARTDDVAAPAAPRHHPAARHPVTHRPAADHPRPAHDGHEFSAQSVAATLRTALRREPGRVVAGDATGPELYDIHAVEASLTGTAPVEQRAPAVGTADPVEGTWEPVPVPPPTYTLKAKAYRPLPTGANTLPADGTEMALDEEFEDLPRIDRVG